MANNVEVKQDGFKSKWGFILACIGSAVGMGNIWRFPSMVSKWGGLTFLIPYFLFVLLVGASGVIGEFTAGRASGSGPIGACGYLGEKKGQRKLGEIMGTLPLVGSLALAIGYTVVVGWIFKYTFMALTGSLSALGTDMNVIGGTFGATAPECASLGESIATVLAGNGNMMWLIVGIIVAVIIMALGIADGIEVANKVMMPALFILFVGLAFYIGTLPGASEAYKYIFTLNPAGLLDPLVWIYAFGQAFFSLSVAGNGSVIYGSYLGKDVDIFSSARNVAFFDTIAALLAMMVILPAMAAGGAPLDQGGPGLMFVWLVNVFNGMTGGKVIGIVFFLCVMFAGVSSIVNLYESPVSYVQQTFKLSRKVAVGIVGLFGCVVAIFIQGYASQWMDIVSIYICPMGAAILGYFFFWVMPEDEMYDAVNEGSVKPIGKWLRPLGKYVYVPLSIIAIIAGAALGGIG